MFARVSVYWGSPEKVESGIRYLEESAAAVERLEGFRGTFFLVDRKRGKGITITLWESVEALRAAAIPARPLRADIAESLGSEEPPMVEVYEVALQSLSGLVKKIADNPAQTPRRRALGWV